ncbi:hypothetical protein AgCh_001360 [Apium graveolens]
MILSRYVTSSNISSMAEKYSHMKKTLNKRLSFAIKIILSHLHGSAYGPLTPLTKLGNGENVEYNLGRRFLTCATQTCNFFKWPEPEFNGRSRGVINGPLRNIGRKDNDHIMELVAA